MLAAGIKTPVPLEELEIHLREEIEQQSKTGLNEQETFELSVQQIGQAGMLKTEFAKAGGIIPERLKQIIFTLAGIPNYQLAMNMNTTNSNIEPRWATYLKAAAFILPAIFLWIFSCTFVLPLLKQICDASGIFIPKSISTALALSDLVQNHFIVGSIVILFALVLLEWRSHRWPRYRRSIFGILAFLLNSTVLIFITVMFALAVVAGAHLLHPMNGGR